MKKFVKWFVRILPFVYIVFIWVLSSYPSNAVVELPDEAIDRFIKEALHLVEFAILYVFLLLFVLTFKNYSLKLNLLCAVIASLYGISDEIHQSFVPCRSLTLIDVVKDIIGVTLSAYFVHKWQKKLK